jgi:hypothetical protein
MNQEFKKVTSDALAILKIIPEDYLQNEASDAERELINNLKEIMTEYLKGKENYGPSK